MAKLTKTQWQMKEAKAARELGGKAWRDGRKAIPALDPALMDYLKANPECDGLVALKAWVAGWHETNLKNRGTLV